MLSHLAIVKNVAMKIDIFEILHSILSDIVLEVRLQDHTVVPSLHF